MNFRFQVARYQVSLNTLGHFGILFGSNAGLDMRDEPRLLLITGLREMGAIADPTGVRFRAISRFSIIRRTQPSAFGRHLLDWTLPNLSFNLNILLLPDLSQHLNGWHRSQPSF